MLNLLANFIFSCVSLLFRTWNDFDNFLQRKRRHDNNNVCRLERCRCCLVSYYPRFLCSKQRLKMIFNTFLYKKRQIWKGKQNECRKCYQSIAKAKDIVMLSLILLFALLSDSSSFDIKLILLRWQNVRWGLFFNVVPFWKSGVIVGDHVISMQRWSWNVAVNIALVMRKSSWLRKNIERKVSGLAGVHQSLTLRNTKQEPQQVPITWTKVIKYHAVSL